VLLSRVAKTFVDNLVNAGFPFRIVGDNDQLPLGGKTLRFINAPFLHWPDTILTYLVEEKILFPCDFLGAHYSSPHTSTTSSTSRRKPARRSSSTTRRSCGRTRSTSSRRASGSGSFRWR